MLEQENLRTQIHKVAGRTKEIRVQSNKLESMVSHVCSICQIMSLISWRLSECLSISLSRNHRRGR